MTRGVDFNPPPKLLPDLRGLPRPFWLLFSAALLDRLGGFVIPYLAIYLTSPAAGGGGGLSVGRAGLVVSALGVGGLVGAPLGGIASDRFGRKPVLVGGWGASALALAHLGLAHGALHIALAAFLWGVTASFARPAMSAAIADVVPEPRRLQAFGLHYWAINLGFAVAATLAGALVKVSYGIVFGLDALSSLVAALFLLLALPETRSHEHARLARSTPLVDTRVVRDRAFLAVFVASLLVSLVFQQAHVALATEIAHDGLTTRYGPLLAINGVLIVLLQPFASTLAARWRAVRVLAAGSLLVGVGFFLTAFADAAWQHAAAIAVWTIGEIALASTTPAIISRLAPAHRRGAYQGFFSLSWSFAAVGPALGAWLLDAHGSIALWGACFGAAIIAAAVQANVRDPRLA